MCRAQGPQHSAPIGAVCSGYMLFPSIPTWSVMLGNYLQQTTSGLILDKISSRLGFFKKSFYLKMLSTAYIFFFNMLHYG